MTPAEFRTATHEWARGVKTDQKTDWSGGIVAAWEFASTEEFRAARRLATRATGVPVGINSFDDRKTLLLVMPTEEMASLARNALGQPKFSAALTEG